MVQPKAIFTGRKFRSEHQKLAVNNRIKLEVASGKPINFSKYDYAFVSGYLSIIEALKARVPVFAYYDNPVKNDYLTMTPFVEFITIFNDFRAVVLKKDAEKVLAGQKWANTQTWDKVTDLYEQLWQIK